MIVEQTRDGLSIRRFTSSEAGGWSNSYLISGKSEAILFDVFMLHSDAAQLAKEIETSGKMLKAVMISHAHPDHFMGSDAIVERFPNVPVVSTSNVIKDIAEDSPWMFSIIQKKWGAEAPKRVLIPEPITANPFEIDGIEVQVMEFPEGESKHLACLYIPSMKALISGDVVDNGAHLYMAERHMESWISRLDEIETFAKDRIATFYPGHGPPGDLSLIAKTREYLRDFKEAIQSGDGKTAEKQMLAKYPDLHAKQFLTIFSIPAYFPPPTAK
jgi:glyoxylase-like metal-dependent hydrolase (beta-lactamase superfamily II)